jgi:Mce-associated membrane protein
MSEVDRVASEPTAGPAGTETAGLTGWAKLAIAAVVLAVVAVTVLAVVMQRYSSRTHRVTSDAVGSYLAGPTALAAERAAVTGVQATLSYDYNTLSSDFANAEKSMTPGFRTTYMQKTQSSVTPLATKNHVIVTATVSAAGISSAAPRAVTVLVFANQTVQNKLLAHPRLDRTRIKVSMVNLGGKWLIDNLSPV